MIIIGFTFGFLIGYFVGAEVILYKVRKIIKKRND